MEAPRLTITIESRWIKAEGDCSVCICCEEMIFGNKHVLAFVISGYDFENIVDTEYVFCESCKNCVE